MRGRPFWILLLYLLAPVVLFGCLFLGPSGLGLPDRATMIGKSLFALRANRVILGFIVGAALSCAGVAFQAILRNPLAEPYILGVSSGAGLGATFAILTGLAAGSIFALPLIAFLAAAATLTLVFLVAGNRGTPSVYNLILSGVIISAVCSSILMFLVATAPVHGLHSVIWWMLGNLQPMSRELLFVSGSIIVVGCVIIWALSPELNALTLGRDTAHNLGIRTNVAIVLGLGVSTLVTAAAVGLSGLIGFVGLIVPHVMRSIVGPEHRRLIPAAAIGGGLFLAVCDALARTVMAPVEIPVGVVTAVCGGPFFLAILRHKNRVGLTG